MRFDNKHKCTFVSVLQSVTAAFDNAEDSDIKFNIAGKVIQTHKTILKLRSGYFQAMFRSGWKEGELGEVTITNYSYDVYKAFLKYLYTEKVEISAENAMYLLDLATCYGEHHLQYECEKIIKQEVCADNAATLYQLAVKYDRKNPP